MVRDLIGRPAMRPADRHYTNISDFAITLGTNAHAAGSGWPALTVRPPLWYK